MELVANKPNLRLIKGHSGGSDESSARTPSDSADTLKSKSFARILDGIGEGEIEGFAHPDDPMRDIYLAGTPIKAADGTINYPGVVLDYRFGTRAQTPIDGFNNVENTVSVGVEIKASSGPHTETIDNVNANAARITISTSGFVTTDPKTGDRTGSSVRLTIDVASGSGPFVNQIDYTLDGKSAGRYEEDFLVKLSGGAPYRVRVTRLTPDSTSASVTNTTVWGSYTEVVNGKLSYPNTALVGMVISAEQFSSIPVRGYDLRLLRVKVPSNYDPLTRLYNGVWDGTFKVAWTDNPVWQFYDLVTNERYGCGTFIEGALPNKWNLYKISKYCDELVDDGFGGTEPRFTCNVYLQTQQDVYDVLNDFASVFRAIIYMQNGEVTAVQDAPADPIYTFTNSNIVDGQFAYSGTARKARFTAALVTWNDPNQNGKQAIEYVPDQQGITRYGFNPTKIVAFGCTSRGQAHRAGKWLLYAGLQQTEMNSFSAGLEGVFLYPGAIIEVQDAIRAGARVAGRVLGSTSTTVQLDSAVTFQLGQDYEVVLVRSDVNLVTWQPTDEQPRPVTQMRATIVNPATAQNPTVATDSITLATALPVLPMDNSIWRIASPLLDSQQFKVISIKETDGKPNVYAIDALQYNPGQFDLVERDIALSHRPITVYPSTPKVPTNVTLTEHAVTTLTAVQTNLTMKWDRLDVGVTYIIQYKKDSDNWVTLPDDGTNSTEIPNVITGSVYQGRVAAVTVTNLTSGYGYSDPYTVLGKTQPPPGLSNLRAETDLWKINLFWEFAPYQPDVKLTEIYISKVNDRATAERLAAKAFPSDAATVTGLQNGDVRYFWGRTQDSSGNWSDFYPLDPFSGVRGISENDNTRIITMLSGQINGSNAGLSIKDQLDELTFPGTGVHDQLIAFQSTLQSLYSEIHSIGARLDPPNGDIASAISLIRATAGVTLVTPRQNTAPANPVFGDAWYDTSSGGALRYWTGTTWDFASTAIVSPTDPSLSGPIATGALWKDTSTPQNFYKIWNGNGWVFASRATIYADAQPPTASAAIGDTWVRTTDGHLFVYNGTLWLDTQSTSVAAIASNVLALQTENAGNRAQIQQALTTVNGVLGLYSLKIDVNGHVAGFALSETLLEDGSTISDFVVDANRFAVGDPSVSGIRPFIVVNGQVYIANAFIGAASIDTLKLAGNAVTIPLSVYVPGAVTLSPSPAPVVSGTVSYPVAPASVNIVFTAEVNNGGGGNGSSQHFVYRNGVLVGSGENGIVNNVYANTALISIQDNPGPGNWTYEVRSNFAGNITSATMSSRSLQVTGSLR